MEPVLNPAVGFLIEDVDGCEFIVSHSAGKAIISWDSDDEGNETGEILIVYPDGSYETLSNQEAQGKIDRYEWVVWR